MSILFRDIPSIFRARRKGPRSNRTYDGKTRGFHRRKRKVTPFILTSILIEHVRQYTCKILNNINSYLITGVGGVTVSMVAFQAVDPGSTPGRRTFFFY